MAAEGPVGLRGWTLLGILAAGLWAAWALRLDPAGLVPGQGGLAVARELFARAASPALAYEAEVVPEGIVPLWLRALQASRTTVVFAAAAVSLSAACGLLLGFLASTAWWADDPAGGRAGLGKRIRRAAAPLLYGATRTLVALMRSVHELLWAVLFLAALGRSNLTAVIAIAIPYAGTLAKVFSELIDEAPREAAAALRAAGAGPLQVFLFGLLPRALPDMSAYALYRFECALRSSAILGFFGYPTLGYYIAASFENLHYGEVWTYLYTLVALVALVDLWSGVLRRRFVR
jgi:phosphonate transport system permease protein